jgi:hemoglobin-like flavoprotein
MTKENPMTQNRIRLVQQTFEMILPIADTAAFLFYERFFALDPTVRVHFDTDMTTQRDRLIRSLTLAVRRLDDPAEMVDLLREMGGWHAGYPVQPIHYHLMSRAIVETLADCLGARFTPDMRAAWEDALADLTSLMLRETAVPA